EARLLRNLPAVLAGRTAVVVSHRPAVLGLCDRVVAIPGPRPVDGAVGPVSAPPAGPASARPGAGTADPVHDVADGGRPALRLGPAATHRLRSGDLLAGLVGDVDAQQDVVVRAVVPVASAAIVAAGATTVLALLVPAAGLALAAGLLCAGVLAPALTLRSAR